ncbi:MAG TPA: nickel pincer cofactor biosynthesis protein LarB [Clostridiaceae bacterium]|nr:nickel pincer cofactor biosynthesis protein LarB [Clostridiaceae bacterium]
MYDDRIRDILEQLEAQSLTVDEAYHKLRMAPYDDVDGIAVIDTHRKLRQGVPEVVYGAGKTADQIVNIVNRLVESGNQDILVTRINETKAQMLSEVMTVDYHPIASLAIANPKRERQGVGAIAVVSGGTSDMPVCEEAALTAEVLGNIVYRVYDVGVAGIHRLFAKLDILMSARVVIAVAGMEGALASVVGGLVDAPIVAVPTSVGYGANFQGLSALLSMLNSCATGVGVVNIDNGFGAAVLASRINQMESFSK